MVKSQDPYNQIFISICRTYIESMYVYTDLPIYVYTHMYTRYDMIFDLLLTRFVRMARFDRVYTNLILASLA